MELKTPAFWYRPEMDTPPPLEKALAPLSMLYRAGYEIHQFMGRHEEFDIPILCIGNINAGGTGKTPTALALMELIKKNGMAQNPFFMSRGYGGGEPGPLLVDTEKHTAWHTGDEPLILARNTPTVVSGNRSQGILLAMHRRADLILMDDGLQNPHIRKDLKFIVINGEMGFGNHRLLPAGPLREPLKKGLKKADAFILIGEDKRSVRQHLPQNKPVFTAHLTAHTPLPPGKRYVAFAGIGYPEKFFSFLRENQGADLVETVTFPDHYPYTAEDIRALQEKAHSLNADLITTEKDYIRVPKTPELALAFFSISLAWDDEAAITSFLQPQIAALM